MWGGYIVKTTQHRRNETRPQELAREVRPDEWVFDAGCDHSNAVDDGDVEGVLWCQDCREFILDEHFCAGCGPNRSGESPL